MAANCCTNGRPTSPKSAGRPHRSTSRSFCSSCKRHPEPQRTTRDLTFGHTSSNLCEHDQIEGPLHSLAMTRGRLLSSYENFPAVDVRPQHLQFWREHNQIGIFANCDFTFVGQASLARWIM